MNRKKTELAIKEKLGKISGTSSDDWHLISRARHGMQIIFKEINNADSNKNKIITLPFTCITAINPIISSGNKPCYSDIKQNTLSVDPDSIKSLITSCSSAIVMQHSFGIPANSQEIFSIAKEHSLVLVEDSAHCLGFLAKNAQGKIAADFSIHSFGAEKILNTKFGAAIWINPGSRKQDIKKKVQHQLENLPEPSLIEVNKIKLYPILNRCINLAGRIRLGDFARQFFIFTRLLYAPIMPCELRGENYKKGTKIDKNSLQKISQELVNIGDNKKHRIELAGSYIKNLRSNKQLSFPGDILKNEAVAYVRLPIIAKSKELTDSLFNKLQNKNIPIGKWYRPLLFPGTKESENIYLYEPKTCPVAEDISARILNLPTGTFITLKKSKEIVNEINR